MKTRIYATPAVKELKGPQQTLNGLVNFPSQNKQATHNHEDFSLGISKSVPI